MRIPLLLPLGLLLSWFPVGAEPLRAQQIQLPTLDDRGAAPQRIAALCGSTAPMGRTELLPLESSLQDSVATRPGDADLWSRLACSNARLFAVDWRARIDDSPLSLRDWAQGTLRFTARALQLDSTHAVAAPLLAVMSLELSHWSYQGRQPGRSIGIVPEGLVDPALAAVRGGVAVPAVLRLCTSMALNVRDPATARFCSDRALATGADSSWHLVRMAWLEARAGDTSTAVNRLNLAIASGRDSVSWHELSRVLANFFSVHPSPRTPAREYDHEWLTRERWSRNAEDFIDWFILVVTERHGTGVTSYAQHAIRELRRLGARGAGFHTCAMLYGVGGARDVGARCEGDWEYTGRSEALHVSARVHRLWRLPDGAEVTVAPWRVSDGVRPGEPVEVNLRRWSQDVRWFTDTTVAVTAVEGRTMPQGVVEALAAASPSSWTLRATQGGIRRGRALSDGFPTIGLQPLGTSDLVLGQSQHGLTWHSGESLVALSPSEAMDHRTPVLAYLQWRYERGVEDATLSIRIRRMEGGGRDTARAVESRGRVTLHSGVNELRRELDISRLSRGRYRVEMAIHEGPTLLGLATASMLVQ